MDSKNQYQNSGDIGLMEVSVKKFDDGATQIKNLRGDLGPICSYCAGLGFTGSMTGGSLGCKRCEQTGVEPINTRELAVKVDNIQKELKQLIKLVKGVHE